MSDKSDDLFEDEATAVKGEYDDKKFDEPNTDPDQPKVDKVEDAKDKTGEKQASDAPPADDKKEGDDEPDGEKVPLHRFKAALKDVQDKLEAALNENATLKAAPIPDKATDPEGHALHIRMESSKALMREYHTDYDEVIKHYVDLAKDNPDLDEKVASHPLPAKFAYDLAKESLEIQRLRALKNSPEFKEFEEFKKTKTVKTEEAPSNNTAVTKGLTSKVPNLNRATDVSKGVQKTSADEDDEYLFGDATF